MNTFKYKFHSSLFFLILVILGFSSCETFIEVDAEDRPQKLVVFSGFEPGQPWQVSVSHSVGSFSNDDISLVSDAQVRVSATDGSYEETLTHSLDHYISEYTPLSGVDYRIEVSVSNFPTVSSISRIPMISESIELDTVETFRDGNQTFDFELTFNDPADEDNYYLVQLFSIYQEWKTSIMGDQIYIESKDPNVENSFDDWESVLFLKDQNFNGKEYTLRFYSSDGYWEMGGGSNYVVRLISCSEDYYRFQKTLRQYNYTYDNPFSQPVQIYSNIENGIGLFGGYVVSEVPL